MKKTEKVLHLLIMILILVAAFFIKTANLKAMVNIGRFDPTSVKTAEPAKRNKYIKEGLVVGGDRAISDVIVLDIRHAVKKHYERMVLDIEGNRGGNSETISRPPYYHVALSPALKRLEVTVWGRPKLAFNGNKVLRKFRKSRAVRKVELLPVVEKDRWTFVLHLKRIPKIEVFELNDPVRVIVDMK